MRAFRTRSLPGEQGPGGGGWPTAPNWEWKPGLGNAAEFWMTLRMVPHRPQASGGKEGIITLFLESQAPQERLQNAQFSYNRMFQWAYGLIVSAI